MKIGRREHLRQLGLGAAGMLGAGLFENELSLISHASPRVLPKLKARPWPWTISPPPDENPGIRIIFAGMMIFTHKGRQGRVVFHAGSDHHQLEILVFEREPCKEIFSAKEPNIPAKIELTSPPGHADDVQFFSLDPDNFNRKDWHNKDFRWLLDLEGPETYSNKDFERTEDKGFNKKLYVESGRFYTYQRTNSTFRAEMGSLMCAEFSIARFMACDIALAGSEIFKLKVGGREVPMQNPSKYEIYFLNACDNCKTSDFPMVFDAVKNGEPYKFDLQLVNRGPNTPTPELCYQPLITRGSDEAPCMGASFGGGNGFP